MTKKIGSTRIWTKGLSDCSRLLYHWAILPIDKINGFQDIFMQRLPFYIISCQVLCHFVENPLPPCQLCLNSIWSTIEWRHLGLWHGCELRFLFFQVLIVKMHQDAGDDDGSSLCPEHICQSRLILQSLPKKKKIHLAWLRLFFLRHLHRLTNLNFTITNIFYYYLIEYYIPIL
jgi:hypothetical protein